MGNCTIANLNYHQTRDEAKNDALLTLSSSYATGGDTLTAKQCGLSFFNSIIIATKSGYIFQPIISADKQTALILAYTAGEGGYTPAGTNASSTALDLATPVFSGTGQSSAGQVITTTDNQTMTLNQCAGMWFVSATHGPYLIQSNTAVTGAPAVLTVIGDAPTTDAGAYRILKNVAQTFTGTPASTSGADQVANGTNLTVTPGAVYMMAFGG